LALLGAVFLAFAPITPAWAQPRAESSAARFSVAVQEITTPSGLRAWLVSNDTVPMIVMHAYWSGGSAIEPESMPGVTGVMTDMLTEGAGALDSAAFKERIEDLNIGLSFSAGWDGVGMSLTTLSENRDAAFDLARMALTSPRFDTAPLERIRRQLLVGLRTRETNPSYLGYLALDQALYPGHPYARRATREGVLAIDRRALAARRDALLNRATLRITIVGDINAADAARLIDSTFGGLPQGAPPAEPPQADLRPATPLIVRQLPQPQSLLLWAAPGIQDEDPDWIPLAVANYILGGGGFSSRLMDQVREERGLVYSIRTVTWVRDFAAMIRGQAQTENANVAEAIEVIRSEIRRLYEQGATEAEVRDAITYLTGSFALDLDSNVKIASVVHNYQVAGRTLDYVNQRNDLIRAVTVADVDRVVRRLFNPDAFTFVVVGQPEGLAPPATE